MTAVRRGHVSGLALRTPVRANGYGLSVRRLLLALIATVSLAGMIDLAAVTPACRPGLHLQSAAADVRTPPTGRQ